MFDIQLEPTVIKPLVGRSRIVFTGVDTSGSILPMAITKNAEITQIQVNRTSGSGQFTIEIYSDSLLEDKVFSAVSEEDLLAFNKIGLDYENTDSPVKNSLCYLK
jgi:hypothetical protein